MGFSAAMILREIVSGLKSTGLIVEEFQFREMASGSIWQDSIMEF